MADPATGSADIGAARTLKLRDGRTLAWAEWGDPTGTPIVSFHGTPGSRFERHYDEDVYREVGVRAIVPDRPGFGLSDPMPSRTLLDAAADVRELADHVGVERFAVMGASGGGPYALATGYALPDRVSAVGVVSGVGRLDLPGAMRDVPWSDVVLYGLASKAPPVLDAAVRAMARLARWKPKFAMGHFSRSLSASDRLLLCKHELVSLFETVFDEALRHGGRATVEDYALFRNAWGFDLGDVRAPVYIWHGEEDTLVPVGQARRLVEELPGCIPTFFPGEGHLVFAKHAPQILATLAASL